MKTTPSIADAAPNSTATAPGEASTGVEASTINHYVPKWQITESIVYGTKVTALCGDRYVVGALGGGQTKARYAETCTVCERIYGILRSDAA